MPGLYPTTERTILTVICLPFTVYSVKSVHSLIFILFCYNISIYVSQQGTELRYRGRSFYSQQYAETYAHRVNPTSALLASALRAAINLELLRTRIDT